MCELEVMEVGRGTYIPKGAREANMVISCVASPMKLFVDVELTAEDAAKYSDGKLKKGQRIDVQFPVNGRVNIPFAGSPLKCSGGVVVKVV